MLYSVDTKKREDIAQGTERYEVRSSIIGAAGTERGAAIIMARFRLGN